MTTRATLSAGHAAERRALRFLKRRGLKFVARNYRCRFGEIDLIMTDGDCLVFVEVRSRRNNRVARAGLTVDHRKQKKLIRTAAMYLGKNRHALCPTRFDVVAIDRHDATGVSLEWIRDAFRPLDAEV